MSENVTITNPELKANLEALRIKESPALEQAITPRAFSSGVSCEILKAAPRTLKEPVTCRFSGFR